MKTGRASTVGWLLAILSFALTALLPMTGIMRELQLFFAATVFVIVIMAFELLPVLVSAVFVPRPSRLLTSRAATGSMITLRMCTRTA